MIDVSELTVHFGGVTPLDGMDVKFEAGTCGLIGPNGAGKTTFFNVLSGFVKPAAGDIEAFGENLLKMTHFRRARWGVRRTFQTEQAIEELSVYDNVAMVHEHSRESSGSRRQETLDAISFVGIRADPNAKVGTLGAGERRLVEVARAVVGKPRLVLLDEPAAGLPDKETEHLSEVIRKIPEQTGALTILVDHDMSLVSACCETTAVLDFGRLLASGPTAEVLRDERVVQAYLGGGEGRVTDAAANGNGALRLSDMIVHRGGRPVVRGVTLEVPAGEVTALLGPNGAGKSSLVLAVGGVLRAESGSIVLDGRELVGRRPERIRRAGVAVVPEGRRLLPELTVEENLTVATYSLSRQDARTGRARALELFPELEKRLTSRARSLSGGEQQMVVLAQALVSRPRFMIIDELSLGLAPVIVQRLIPTIRSLAESGIGVLLIEQFATVALGLANRAYVMEGGQLRFSGMASELRGRPDLLHSAYLLAGSER